MPLVPLSGPAEVLMASLRAERITQADAQQAIERFLQACSGRSSDGRQIQFDSLLGVVDESPTGPACFLAVVCGALLEQGAWPGRMGEMIHRRLDEILPQAAYLARECQKREQAAQTPPPSFANLEEEDAYKERLDQRLNKVFEEVSVAHPMAREAWDYLGTLWPACVALYSRDLPARVRGRVFLPVIEPLIDRHEGAHWLQKLLPVLDQEPLLVIDPVRQIGITAKMSGIAENFQLQTLLMNAVPKRWYERRRVSSSAIDVATGLGPQQTEETITGCWNMYQAAALGPDGRIASSQKQVSQHGIWGEGTPTDITVIDGHRVVLLGPPSDVRTWPAVRLFSRLPAGFGDLQVLDKARVRRWIQTLIESQHKSVGLSRPISSTSG